MTTHAATISFQFTEEMKGYLSAEKTDFKDGFSQGKEDGHYFMFHLIIRTDDMDAFLASPEHQAEAVGYVEGDLIGGQRPIEKGVFNLFVGTADLNRRQMRYRLFFSDLGGVKKIQDNVGPDLWSDTATLYTDLFRGHVTADAEPAAALHAVGILHIEAMDFMKQLTTMRAGGVDLYGGVSVNYYRHVYKMVKADNTAVKYSPDDPRYRRLPDNYFQDAAEIETPALFVTGENNKVFTDSNIVCHKRLEVNVPGRHQLHVFPGYGRQDVFMSKNVDQDISPRFLQFLEQNRN